MAKHAKPTLTSTLSKNGARGAAALAMASVGFLATAPAAFATGDGDSGNDQKQGDSNESDSLVSVDDNNLLVPVQACNNFIPVNVLGVQVPVEEVEVNAAIPILNEDGGEADADSSDSCDVKSNQD